MLKTSAEWLSPIVTIVDPDGWDRTNFNFSFYEEEISKEEFEKRLALSTIYVKNK